MKYLAQGWNRLVRFPLLLIVPLVLQIAMSAIGFSAAGAIMNLAQAEQPGAGGGWIVLVGFGMLFGGPAVASGYNAMVARAARGEEATLRVMFTNLGRYYSRILGGTLLMGLGLTLLTAILGLGTSVAGVAIAVVLNALAHVWLAALVMDDCGVWAAFRRTWQQVSARIGDYGPLLVFALLAHYVLPELFSGGSQFDLTQAPTFLDSLGTLISGLLTTTVAMLVRAGTFVAYGEGMPARDL